MGADITCGEMAISTNILQVRISISYTLLSLRRREKEHHFINSVPLLDSPSSSLYCFFLKSVFCFVSFEGWPRRMGTTSKASFRRCFWCSGNVFFLLKFGPHGMVCFNYLMWLNLSLCCCVLFNRYIYIFLILNL